uniref:Uncharacterized protein n=1 Tax=Monopterus albus TaxID=43700 RepID=A0A3Q3JBP2_MONAL
MGWEGERSHSHQLITMWPYHTRLQHLPCTPTPAAPCVKTKAGVVFYHTQSEHLFNALLSSCTSIRICYSKYNDSTRIQMLCSTREILKETLAADEEEFHRDKWTLFGNEAEKLELDVIRNQHVLRTRIDKMAQEKASSYIKYLELLSQKAPDFPIPLRAHTVWEGMTVKLSCTICGSPPPKVTWYKDGQCYLCPAPVRTAKADIEYQLKVLFFLCRAFFLSASFPPPYHCLLVLLHLLLYLSFSSSFFILTMSFSNLVFLLNVSLLALQAQFGTSFPPTWVKEGSSLTLQCTFTSALLPFQQDVSWFRDGIQLLQSSTVDIKTADNQASITLKVAHKEHEGVYTAQLKTLDGIQEHSAFVYVTDASAAVLGGPASPLAVKVSDVNKDYVFLTWQPPSADGASPVDGYYVEKLDLGQGVWVRCNVHIQKMCHYPVFGLKEGTLYQFRVRAVNQAGAGRPSKATEPVLTADPLEHTRTMVENGKTITITKDELEGQVKIPFPPTNVHACEVSDTYMVLSWTEPEPRGREPLNYYVEQVKKSNWELASLDMTVSSPRFPVFDLVTDKQYCFRVRSVNKYGISDPSEICSIMSSPPHSVMAIRDTNTSVLLQWREPKEKDNILGYYMYYSETGKEFNKRFIVHGLKTGKEYVFRVKSVGRAGNSSYSDESQPILVKSAIRVPSAPSAITLLLCTGSEMVLGWRAPVCNGGASVRGYYLDQREKDMKMWREVNIKPTKERQFKVCNLSSGHFYEFRVFAANMAGVGKPSEPSEAFLCEKWTMPEPGCPYDLQVRDVRNNSLVLLWAAPLYEGQSPVTGYFLFYAIQVSDLQAGQTYRLRVSAVNEAGVGCASLPSEPVTAQIKPGTKNIEIGVDSDGFICMSYEADEMNDESQFLWNKNYTEPIDASRARAETKNNRSVLTFTDPTEEDLGLYTVEISDNPNLSSSYDFTAEGKIKLFSLIALKSGWQVEVTDKGGVRLWLQTESLSDDAELRLIFNDQEISSTPHRKINFDKAKGLVEILFDQLSREDEGSYTAQLRDGRAKSQFTLVFVDQKAGSYRAVVSDRRGEDVSTLELLNDARTRPGSSMQRVWIEIFNPTENDKGKYTLEMYDGKETHKRYLDLSGQERAKVTRGLPDVVAIREGKTLCLTCFIDGEPAPEVFWFRNDREIANQNQFTITKEPKCSTITVSNVTMEDSGTYSITVQNQYGSETVEVTVSVYRYGEKIPTNAVEMG